MRDVRPPSPAAPRPIPEILETALRLYRGAAGDLYLVASATLLISWTINLVVTTWTIGGLTMEALEDPRAPELFRTVGQILAAGVANGMVYALVCGLGAAVLTVILVSSQTGAPAGVSQALARAGPYLASVLAATMIYFLAVALLVGMAGLGASVAIGAGAAVGGMEGGLRGAVLGAMAGMMALLVLLVFGLAIMYLSLRWGLYTQVAVLERKGPLGSLRASVSLTRDPARIPLAQRYLFRATTLTFALVLLQIIVGTVGALPKYIVGWSLGGWLAAGETSLLNPTGMPLGLLIPLEMLSVLLSAAVMPFGVAIFVILYLDQRRRSAGADNVASSMGEASGSDRHALHERRVTDEQG